MRKQTEAGWLEYFSGGVPTGNFFKITLDDLSSYIDRTSKDRMINRLNEVCFIGLVSYFEAFCKDHFSSIINIEPSLITRLSSTAYDISIDPIRLLTEPDGYIWKLGFLINDKFDFGTAQKINSFYSTLLKVSPFSKTEAIKYSEILRDRNLLVHHGGTYTHNYLRQTKVAAPDGRDRPYFDSLVVTTDYFDEKSEFISGIAQKIMKSTHSALSSYINENGIRYKKERKKALNSFLWWE